MTPAGGFVPNEPFHFNTPPPTPNPPFSQSDFSSPPQEKANFFSTLSCISKRSSNVKVFCVSVQNGWIPKLSFQFYFQISDATTLSWSTRIKGFIICFCIGVFFSILVSSEKLCRETLTYFLYFFDSEWIISLTPV